MIGTLYSFIKSLVSDRVIDNLIINDSACSLFLRPCGMTIIHNMMWVLFNVSFSFIQHFWEKLIVAYVYTFPPFPLIVHRDHSNPISFSIPSAIICYSDELLADLLLIPPHSNQAHFPNLSSYYDHLDYWYLAVMYHYWFEWNLLIPMLIYESPVLWGFEMSFHWKQPQNNNVGITSCVM